MGSEKTFLNLLGLPKIEANELKSFHSLKLSFQNCLHLLVLWEFFFVIETSVQQALFYFFYFAVIIAWGTIMILFDVSGFSS